MELRSYMNRVKSILKIILILMCTHTSSSQPCGDGKLDTRVAAALEGDLKPRGKAPGPEQVAIDREKFLKLFPQSDVSIIQITADSIPLQVYNPNHATGLPIIISYHEGGFILPIIPRFQFNFWQQAKYLGAIVVAVDYRVAPKHPFPSAVDDSYNTFKWILEHGQELGGDTSKIIVLGVSSGGNLAAVVCQKAKREGLAKKIKLQVLTCPLLDNPENYTEYPSYHQNDSGYFLTDDVLLHIAQVYASEKNYKNTDYAPMLTANLSGLPPAVIITAEFDPLRDQGRVYADRLRNAGVQVWHKCFPGQIHALLGLPNDALELKERNTLILHAMSEIN